MNRVRAFDWLRGIAVVVMIQTHALVLLKPQAQSDLLFRLLVRIDGLVAPAFLFCAGFALALVQCRAARSGRRRAQALTSLRRIAEVLVIASVVNFVWFSVPAHPTWLLRIDILQCIGLSLLVALPLLVGLSSHPRVLRWVMLGLSAAVFAVSPLLENVNGVAGVFVNPNPGWFVDPLVGSVFPLFPWAGYVFLGASTGATLALLTHERELWLWLGLLGGIGAALWANQEALKAAYPPHSFWVSNPANAAQRATVVVVLIALLRLVELRGAASAREGQSWLMTLSTSSLAAYVVHEMLLYQRHVGVFTRFWREQCGWALYALLLVALTSATWLGVRAWSAISSAARRRFAS
jgi:uncharacterized membrane protein